MLLPILGLIVSVIIVPISAYELYIKKNKKDASDLKTILMTWLIIGIICFILLFV